MYKLLGTLFLATIVIIINGNELELYAQPAHNNFYQRGEYSNLFRNEDQNNTKPKMCRYRDEGLFPNVTWNWKAGEGCYRYFPADWFIQKLRTAYRNLTIDGVTYRIPVGLGEAQDILFDYTNVNYSQMIADTFITEVLYLKWRDCAITADKCCTNLMNEYNIYPNENYACPATWDAWSCFHPAITDSISELPCPPYTTSSTDAFCILYSNKVCRADGTWNQQTDYSTCAAAPVYRKRHNFHVTVLYVSIALSFPAVIILTGYPKLRILRVNLHRNLLVACILRNIFTILSKELVILDSLKPSHETNHILTTNGVGCRILAFWNNVAANAIYACMLIDGFYLHKLIVRIFSADPNSYILYGITVVLSFLPSLIWAVLLAIGANEYCWMVDSSWYQWIPDGFRIAILSINIILLLDIIRALICKLRQNVSAQHTKTTFKATLFLIPLFGVPFILTANRNIVNQESCKAVDIFYYVSYSIQALQGVMVAILFCYWNTEVHTQIKGTSRIVNLQYQARFGSQNDRSQVANRRETARTYVPNDNVTPQMDNPQNSIPLADLNTNVNQWLTNNLAAIETSTFISNTKTNSEEDLNPKSEFLNTSEINENIEPNNLSHRVSQFIDDSNENLGPSENNAKETS